MKTCWRCSTHLDDYGFCPSCDVKGFRLAAPRVVLPPGVRLEAVVFRKSGQRLTPEAARTAKLIYVETSGHDVHVYLLHSALDVCVSADRLAANPQPEPERLPTFIKG